MNLGILLAPQMGGMAPTQGYLIPMAMVCLMGLNTGVGSMMRPTSLVTMR